MRKNTGSVGELLNGRHIASERALCDVRQDDLAIELNMNRVLLSQIENNKIPPLEQAEYHRIIEAVRRLGSLV